MGYRVERTLATNLVERVLNVPYPLPEPIALLRALRRQLASADVVHVQDALYASSAAGLYVAQHRGVASVLTQHVAFVPQGKPWLDAVQRAAIASIGRSARLATLVATYNPAVCDWATRTWGIADARVLPTGVPVRVASDSDRARVRASFSIPADRFVALFVGRDVPKKGLDAFLAASAPEYELVAVTDRPKGTPAARVLPFMSSERLHQLMSCVDAFVLPSLAGEGIPLALQEALVAGLPIVTTRLPGYERFLSDQDVLYVEAEPGSIRAALQQLTGDQALTGGLAERARSAGERHFGIEPFISAYEDIYLEARESRATPL
jgi:glycosyltransferase involved in cell wall biosynthesis